ncbi:hypothetical protein ABW19_dt0209822 [Dactylella cylindrospora]|nr:hypothetical protein ABW19_dt0209822 [Dactylella cylindrospora]
MYLQLYRSTALLSYLLVLIPSAVSQESASIEDSEGYRTGRRCLQNCFFFMNSENGCGNYDSCICRVDLQAQMTNYLSSCLSTSCAATVDVLSGVSIYQSYCSGKGGVVTPVVEPIATQEVIETTIIDRKTVEVVATVTTTRFATDTVEDRTTITSITGTITTSVPSTATLILYSTWTTRIEGQDALQQAADTWGVGGEKGLGTKGKIAIGLGVVAGVLLVAFLVTLYFYIQKRKMMNGMSKEEFPMVGGIIISQRTTRTRAM